MATASASTWVALAVAVALGYRGLAGLHIAPGYGQFAHIPLAWGALAVALSRGHLSPLARRCLVADSPWVLRGTFDAGKRGSTSSRRGVFRALANHSPSCWRCSFDPPDGRGRKVLLGTCGVRVAVQVPLAYWQAHTLGWGDPVQGTLYGSGAGAHVIGAVAIIGAFWYVGRARRALSPSSIVVMALMAGIVLIADAKQVAFALPVAVLAMLCLPAR